MFRRENKELIARDPSKGVKDERPNYLVITFFKDGRPKVASTFRLDEGDGPKMMSQLQNTYGKEITTRTWKTVHRMWKTMTGG